MEVTVTSAGIKQLRHALPRVQIERRLSDAFRNHEDAVLFG